jgi:hypothetical protein
MLTLLVVTSLVGCAIIVPEPYYAPYHGHHGYYRSYR